VIVDGNYWRLYNFISEARSYEIGDDDEGDGDGESGGHNHVREAAAAFARFQRDVADIPQPRLHETIPAFGDSSFRFEQFQQASAANGNTPASGCCTEIESALARRSDASALTDMLKSGQIPERVAHYDTKINNILIDSATGYGLCVIDLDTVMPGLAIYEFGDAVRAATALTVEGEVDLTKVGFSMDKFKLLTEGYLSVAKYRKKVYSTREVFC
jgi:Ser/Thr protein kinase RdoA (MazF antagonist)